MEKHKFQNTLAEQAKIMEKISQIKTYTDMLQSKKEEILTRIEESEIINRKESFLNENITGMLKAKGERSLSKFTFEHLLKALSTLGYAGKILTKLVNEIIFEVRFGSLKHGKSGEALSTEKAVNIGIKLVREKRWQPPSAIQDFVQ